MPGVAPAAGRAGALVALFIAMITAAPGAAAQDYAAQRHALVAEIRDDARDTAGYTDRDSFDERVMQAMAVVPRHEFVPQDYRDYAYRNRPLPIGHGQTISQPYIVALMTDLLRPGAGDRVLEVGTGSGYQAAVLSGLVDRVYTIEIIEELGRQAEQRLRRLGYTNVEARLGDGYYGWEEQSPFDAIIVTAAASHIPPPLVQQIRPGGIMVIPVGSQFQVQQLTLVEKDPEGRVTTRQVLPVQFVPLTGRH